MNLSHEPVLTAAGAAALVSAVIGVLVAFGVPLTSEQRQTVIDLVMVAFPIVAFLVAAWVARSKVAPVSKLEEVSSGPKALEQIEAKN